MAALFTDELPALQLAGRLAGLQAALDAAEVDALVVTTLPNVRVPERVHRLGRGPGRVAVGGPVDHRRSVPDPVGRAGGGGRGR